ncbi:PLAT domain-containing protein 3 [Selaginella moellendorffii]|uniref:PLAT domain-containing protein 3 n=1 Tax=Selaginella moellendorffii TaxID=88036 RepID=UPI000D1C6C55|nr:PLAT domain-containing protein 3 [Selaginella moellendorffii]|eukprot:XP_002968265.2 PLAT domain-containing protein 3 [Selaginella moellendorffii]
MWTLMWGLSIVASALALAIALSNPAAAFAGSRAQNSESLGNCVYTIYVRTGSIFKGGSDANMSVELIDTYNNSLTIDNIETWGGLMPSGWNYFERGNLDVFSGRGSCLSTTPCKLVLTSDGSGSHHGWYVNYAEVSITGPHLGCSQRLFTIEQWLATDTSPYELSATVDKCQGNGDPSIQQA